MLIMYSLSVLMIWLLRMPLKGVSACFMHKIYKGPERLTHFLKPIRSNQAYIVDGTKGK